MYGLGPATELLGASRLLSPRCSACRPTPQYELAGSGARLERQGRRAKAGYSLRLESQNSWVEGLLPTPAKTSSPSSVFSLNPPSCRLTGCPVFVFETHSKIDCPLIPLVGLYLLWWQLPFPENLDCNGKWSTQELEEESNGEGGAEGRSVIRIVKKIFCNYFNHLFLFKFLIILRFMCMKERQKMFSEWSETPFRQIVL